TAGAFPLLQRTEYSYDERGQLIRVSKALFQDSIATSDPWASPDVEFDQAVRNGYVTFCDTLIFYDGNQRIFRYVDALGSATTFEYDAANRQISSTEPSGNLSRVTYDAATNVVREDRYWLDSAGTTRAVISNAFEYDPLSRITAKIDGAGNRETRGLDSRGL